MKIFLKLSFFMISILAVVVATAYFWIHRDLIPSNNASYDQLEPLELVVEAGDSAHTVGRKLGDLSLKTGPATFVFFSRLFGLHKNLKAGVYHIQKEESLASILTRISQGDGVHASITLLEGWTFRQVMNSIHSHPHVKKTLDAKDIDALSMRLALELGVDSNSIEGWIFPDTYFFQYGATDQQLLKRGVWLQRKTLEEAWQSRSQDSKLQTPRDALNLASIIEKETQHPPDRSLVSGVFHNRLAMKMRLQSDPTIIYGLGSSFDGNLKRKHLKQDSSYNSYLRVGLPPTPISNPGKDALFAAVNPERTEALYFVAKGDGTSHFSRTFREHKKAVNYYQRGKGRPPLTKIKPKTN